MGYGVMKGGGAEIGHGDGSFGEDLNVGEERFA
jgi:hypothetical protein